MQEGLSSPQLPSYTAFLFLSFAFIVLVSWSSKKLSFGAATKANDAPIVGIGSDTWFSDLRGRSQYIRNGYWTIHEGYRKVCSRTTVYFR